MRIQTVLGPGLVCGCQTLKFDPLGEISQLTPLRNSGQSLCGFYCKQRSLNALAKIRNMQIAADNSVTMRQRFHWISFLLETVMVRSGRAFRRQMLFTNTGVGSNIPRCAYIHCYFHESNAWKTHKLSFSNFIKLRETESLRMDKPGNFPRFHGFGKRPPRIAGRDKSNYFRVKRD